MSSLWNNIIEFWDKKQGLTINTLSKEATHEELSLLESYIGHRFPETFKSVYKTHNGCDEYIIYPHPSRLLSTEEILNQWNYLNQILSNDLDKESEFDEVNNSKEVKHVKWNKNWIPFTLCTRGRDCYCLDFDPARYGNKGQIIFFSIDLGDRKFVASSFKQWIGDMCSIINTN